MPTKVAQIEVLQAMLEEKSRNKSELIPIFSLTRINPTIALAKVEKCRLVEPIPTKKIGKPFDLSRRPRFQNTTHK